LNGRYLEILKNAFSIGSVDELYRLAFGNYYLEDHFEKRTLSKWSTNFSTMICATNLGSALTLSKQRSGAKAWWILSVAASKYLGRITLFYKQFCWNIS